MIASPSTYPCQWVSGSLIVSDLEIAIASPSFAGLFLSYQVIKVREGKIVNRYLYLSSYVHISLYLSSSVHMSLC